MFSIPFKKFLHHMSDFYPTSFLLSGHLNAFKREESGLDRC